MNANDFTYLVTGILIGAGIMWWGIKTGIKIVYIVKENKPLDDLTVPTEQEDTFEEEKE